MVGLSLRNERRRDSGDISIDKMDVWGAIVAVDFMLNLVMARSV